VSNNKNKCKILYNNDEYELTEKFKLINFLDLKGNNLIIKLKGINNIFDMSYMFCDCYSLISLPDISKINTSKINNMKSMFDVCNSLLSLPDLSKWSTSKVTDM